MSKKEYVILVDEKDNQIGLMEKEEAHVKALLHRAFSVFVFNDKNELLLQQRAHEKYHSGGLWTNTCCSHPREHETISDAAHRRLMEEMGFDCELKTMHKFIYKASFSNGLTEHELDYVLKGFYQGEVLPNKDEVHNYKWVDMAWLLNDIHHNPDLYTAWFKLILTESVSYLVK